MMDIEALEMVRVVRKLIEQTLAEGTSAPPPAQPG